MASLAIRFAMYADGSGGPLACWPWTGAVNEAGYGVIKVGRAIQKAHRVAMQLNGVTIPDGILVLHECDSPRCVNPAHLHLGNQALNMAEAAARGRLHRSSRLSIETVRAIRRRRADGLTYSMIAKEFNVAISTVARIAKREVWADI